MARSKRSLLYAAYRGRKNVNELVADARTEGCMGELRRATAEYKDVIRELRYGTTRQAEKILKRGHKRLREARACVRGEPRPRKGRFRIVTV